MYQRERTAHTIISNALSNRQSEDKHVQPLPWLAFLPLLLAARQSRETTHIHTRSRKRLHTYGCKSLPIRNRVDRLLRTVQSDQKHIESEGKQRKMESKKQTRVLCAIELKEQKKNSTLRPHRYTHIYKVAFLLPLACSLRTAGS